MINNSTNIKMNRHLSPQNNLTQKTTTYDAGYLESVLGQAG
jgi:hypothetical protein